MSIKPVEGLRQRKVPNPGTPPPPASPQPRFAEVIRHSRSSSSASRNTTRVVMSVTSPAENSSAGEISSQYGTPVTAPRRQQEEELPPPMNLLEATVQTVSEFVGEVINNLPPAAWQVGPHQGFLITRRLPL